MRIGELARRGGVTVKAVRYYETLGLMVPDRLSNGYRDYDERDVRAVAEIRELSQLGIRPRHAGPFVDCLDAGHEHGDECPASLAALRDSIAELDRTIDSLAARRAVLAARLSEGASRSFSNREDSQVSDYTTLPAGLPQPADDGAADHLPGSAVPPITLASTAGGDVDLAALGPGRSVVYLYPLTGRPGVDLPAGWDDIPGARGCSTEACDFRDHHQELADAGVRNVWGLSSQDGDYQREVAARLALPFEMLSDEGFELADALGLPTFAAPGHERLYARLTLVITDGVIEHAFYPIFPPNTHAQQVLDWVRSHPE
ncbi:redoxin family protein [Saxibacter everestensis]|uniref:Redoxin family protein n=1 Tax=Saxibacter everestensis TaxID=2909229 RepID=A0ABY8QVV7_9MICO|nr:redoxin family protein [Brevibacteriaceae bacterium ZFBP1038]